MVFDSNSKLVSGLNKLVQDPDFLELNSLLQSKFNLFHLLEIESKEIYYSKILSWLINPYANHKLEDLFLRNFLKNLIEINPDKFNELNINYIEIDCMPFENVKVSVEQTILSKKRLDIFVKINPEKEKWILVIENKILSDESPYQTKFYREELEKEFPDYKRICVFLTPEGKKPYDNNFISCEWFVIYETLRNILDNMESTEDEITFLNQFNKSIEVYVMKNPKLEELCENIFNKYEEALNFLYEKLSKYNIGSFVNLSDDIDLKIKKKIGDKWNCHKGKGWNIICKQNWIDIQEKNRWDHSKYFNLAIFHCTIEKNQQIKIYFYTRRNILKDDLRETFRQKFKEALSNPSRRKSEYDQLFNLDNKKSWLNYTVVENIEDIGNEMAVNKAVEELSKIIKEYEPILDKIIDDLSVKFTA